MLPEAAKSEAHVGEGAVTPGACATVVVVADRLPWGL